MNFNRYFSQDSFASTIVLAVPFFAVLLALVPVPASPARAQESDPQAKSGGQMFFSGNVVEVAADHLSVSRSVLGKAPEKREFKITSATRVEGKIKQKSRVTVRYAAGEEGDIVALAIIVRADKPDAKYDEKKKK